MNTAAARTAGGGYPDARRFRPWWHQEPLMGALVSGTYRRAVAVWHRRGGKDKTGLNITVEVATAPPPLGRVGNYAHVFPEATHGRNALWTNIDNDGFRTIDHWPASLIRRKVEQDMFIELTNGSTWQVLGAKDVDRFRSLNPVGVVLSEYPKMRPSTRNVVAPILRANKGWELVMYTPLGKNHGHTLFRMAQSNPEYFCERLTVDDTGILTPADIQAERDAGMPEEWIQQEYYCSFEGVLVGAYYAREMEAAERDGRLGFYPWDPATPVDITWDLGIGADDATVIWFIQTFPGGFRAIDYYETNREGLPEIVRVLQDKPYTWGRSYFPHDVRRRELSVAQGRGAGTRLDSFVKLMPVFRERGRVVIVPAMDPADRINATRRLLPRFQFNLPACQEGVDAMRSYRREENEKRARDETRPFFKDHPLHDWASHAADSLGHFCVATPDAPRPRKRAEREREAQEEFGGAVGLGPRRGGGRSGRTWNWG